MNQDLALLVAKEVRDLLNDGKKPTEIISVVLTRPPSIEIQVGPFRVVRVIRDDEVPLFVSVELRAIRRYIFDRLSDTWPET